MEDEDEEMIEQNPNELPSKIINTLNEDGFTPFLRYVNEFTIQGRNIYQKIENHIVSSSLFKYFRHQTILRKKKI